MRGWMAVAVLGLSGCHGEVTLAQAQLEGVQAHIAPAGSASSRKINSGSPLRVRALPSYQGADFRQVLSDTGASEGFAPTAELWPYPLPSQKVYVAVPEALLSDGTRLPQGDELEIASDDHLLEPSRRVVVVKGLAVAAVKLADVRESPLSRFEWKVALIRALQDFRFDRASHVASLAEYPQLAHIGEEQEAAAKLDDEAILATPFPALLGPGARPGVVFARKFTVDVLDRPGGALIKRLPFGTAFKMKRETKGWAEVSYELPTELFIDAAFQNLTTIAPANTGTGVAKVEDLTSVRPSVASVESATVATPSTPQRALNAAAYLHLLKNDAWDRVVTLSFAADDFTYLRALVQSHFGRLHQTVESAGSARTPSVAFYSGCWDYLRRGRVADLQRGRSGYAVVASPGDEAEAVDCYETRLAYPCELEDEQAETVTQAEQSAFDKDLDEAETLRDAMVDEVDRARKAYAGLIEEAGVRITFSVPEHCEDLRYFVYRSTHTVDDDGEGKRKDARVDDEPLEIPAQAMVCGTPVVIRVTGVLAESLEYGVLRARNTDEAKMWLASRGSSFSIQASRWGPQIHFDHAPPAFASSQLIAWGLSRTPPGECTAEDASPAAFLGR